MNTPGHPGRRHHGRHLDRDGDGGRPHQRHARGDDQDEKTPLTIQLEKLTRQLLVIAGLALVASIALGLARDVAFETLFLTAVAFSVSAIPSELPAVVTAILSKGTQTLAAAGAIVKRLRSVETLGSTSAINSDKTGTLTLNQMTAVQMALVGRRYTISGEGYSTIGVIAHAGGQSECRSRAVPAADDPVRGCGGSRRRARRRPDRGRAGGARVRRAASIRH